MIRLEDWIPALSTSLCRPGVFCSTAEGGSFFLVGTKKADVQDQAWLILLSDNDQCKYVAEPVFERDDAGFFIPFNGSGLSIKIDPESATGKSKKKAGDLVLKSTGLYICAKAPDGGGFLRDYEFLISDSGGFDLGDKVVIIGGWLVAIKPEDQEIHRQLMAKG